MYKNKGQSGADGSTKLYTLEEMLSRPKSDHLEEAVYFSREDYGLIEFFKLSKLDVTKIKPAQWPTRLGIKFQSVPKIKGFIAIPRCWPGYVPVRGSDGSYQCVPELDKNDDGPESDTSSGFPSSINFEMIRARLAKLFEHEEHHCQLHYDLSHGVACEGECGEGNSCKISYIEDLHGNRTLFCDCNISAKK